jgi:hypothetical protein
MKEENKMENYASVFTITPEILNFAYGIAADLERKENRIKTIHSSLREMTDINSKNR